MSEDPWITIKPAKLEHRLSANLVNPDFPWSFFWARDHNGRHLLLLRHTASASPVNPLPQLRGIEISVKPSGTSGESLLLFLLVDSSNREIFHQLCLDVILSTESATDESAAVECALRRTWRWHYLLRSGRDQRLTDDEQKGLIGELIVMDRFLVPELSAADTVRSWLGPTGAPKDFEVGRFCIEAKARRGPARPSLAISSEDQLDTDSVDRLFVHVSDLVRAPSDGTGKSVSDYAIELMEQIEKADPVAADRFAALLLSAGLRPEDDYSGDVWVEGASRILEVLDDFPRIVPSMLSPGVSKVAYSINLQLLDAFEVSADYFRNELRRSIDGK